MTMRGFLFAAMTALVLAAGLSPMIAKAVEPDEILAEPALETRARALSRELRCMVCQNESIDDSHAELARDLRLIVRERLKAGDSDAAVLSYLTARYGDFVLLRPRFATYTLILWGTPALVFLIGAVLALSAMRRRQAAVEAEPPLDPAEEEALSSLLAQAQKNASSQSALPKRNSADSSA